MNNLVLVGFVALVVFSTVGIAKAQTDDNNNTELQNLNDIHRYLKIMTQYDEACNIAAENNDTNTTATCMKIDNDYHAVFGQFMKTHQADISKVIFGSG